MRGGTLNLITAPTQEPVKLDLAKLHCKVDTSAEDELFRQIIKAAREWCEAFTGRQLVGAVWELSRDCFPGSNVLALPKAPLRSVTSVKYLDAAGVEQTVATTVYRVKAFSGPHARCGRISLEYGQAWPSVRSVKDAVTVRFEAGYSAAGASENVAQAAIPAGLVQAMLLVIRETYERRGHSIAGTIITKVPMNAENLAAPYRAIAA